MLKDILSIHGKGGLYRMVAQSKNGIVVEAIEDKKRMMVSQHYQVSSLSDIAIFTDTEEKSLEDVFVEIYKMENGKKTSINHKASPEELKDFFIKILPNYDKDRVYISDIKKVVKWYNLLNEKKAVTFETKGEKAENNEEKIEAKSEKATKNEKDKVATKKQKVAPKKKKE